MLEKSANAGMTRKLLPSGQHQHCFTRIGPRHEDKQISGHDVSRAVSISSAAIMLGGMSAGLHVLLRWRNYSEI